MLTGLLSYLYRYKCTVLTFQIKPSWWSNLVWMSGFSIMGIVSRDLRLLQAGWNTETLPIFSQHRTPYFPSF
jgi:hypothetical protein